MSSATGLEIGRRSPEWRIGKVIGEGACGAVHILEPSIRGSGSTNGSYAIKVAPIPGDSISAKKKKELKHNSDLLYYENLIYTSHLTSLRGEYIPDLPPTKGPPSMGIVGGFRYLVMERMEAPFWDIVPRLLDMSKSSTISIGPVAKHLIKICQAVHEKHLIIVDVKPENFMLTGNATGKSLEKKIRMIDLGLMQSYGSTAGHRQNEQGGMVGTPLYASLNVHKGATVSRRDDLEAIGYVISELILRLKTTSHGAKLDSLLPWSSGKSDEEIRIVKEECMTKSNSKFFSALGTEGNKQAENTMREYFSIVRSMTYKQSPDYEFLLDLLDGLKVSTATTKKVALANKPSKVKAKAHTTKKGVNDVVTVSTRRTRATKRDVEGEGEEIQAKKLQVVEVVDDKSMEVDSDEETFKTTHEGDASFVTCEQGETEVMDWEKIDDGKPKAGRIGVKIIFISGPHEGDSFTLATGERETMTIGSDPSETDGYSIVGDSEVDKSHVKLVLNANKKLKTIALTDLKSAFGTRVNGSLVKKTQKIFINDIVEIGESSFKVIPIPDDEFLSPEPMSKTKFVVMGYDEKVTVSNVTVVERTGVSLVFIAGPYKGESINMIARESETILLGARPGAEDGSSFSMLKDSSISSPYHVRLELETGRKFFSVVVTDLKSSLGTSVNGTKMRKGKTQKAFVNDEIKIGNSTFKIAPLAANVSAPSRRTDLDEAAIAKENQVPAENSSLGRQGVSLVFIAGPYKGNAVDLIKGQSETFVLGAKPSGSGDSSFAMPKDSSISNPSHVRLELDTSKKFFTVMVTDLKSSSGTSVNGHKLSNGKAQKAFINDEIAIGNSVMKIKNV